jgi:hypothetical protein
MARRSNNEHIAVAVARLATTTVLIHERVPLFHEAPRRQSFIDNGALAPNFHPLT